MQDLKTALERAELSLAYLEQQLTATDFALRGSVPREVPDQPSPEVSSAPLIYRLERLGERINQAGNSAAVNFSLVVGEKAAGVGSPAGSSLR